MTGQQATTVVMSRRRQRELLRAWSGWQLTRTLIDPGELDSIQAAGWSGTHHQDPETGERIVGTPAGLGFNVSDGWRNPAEVIPWSEVEEIAKAVPSEVHAQLVEFRERWRAHQSTYPRFTASAAAVGCGRVVPGEKPTPRQEAYAREREAFDASGILPAWYAKRAVLDAERLRLHTRALRLEGGGSEPDDLLEFLDSQQLDQTRGRGGSPRPAIKPPASLDPDDDARSSEYAPAKVLQGPTR